MKTEAHIVDSEGYCFHDAAWITLILRSYRPGAPLRIRTSGEDESLRFRGDYHATIKTLRAKSPAVRFGYQERPDLIVDAFIFSDDPDTRAFQRSFSHNSYGLFNIGNAP